MWHYVVSDVDSIGDGSVTFEEYKQKMDRAVEQSNKLRASLVQHSIGFDFEEQYSDAIWVKTENDRQFTVLTFLMMQAGCSINNTLTDQEYKDFKVANDRFQLRS